MSNAKLKELLEEAARAGLSPEEAWIAPEIQVEVQREEQISKAIEIVENKGAWNKLQERMEGDFSERFMKEMDALPAREFVRVYMKMLEYFKPKIVRVEKDEVEEEDNVIRIEIHNSAPTIDIEHEDIDDKAE